jgi:hypothetical protein
MGILDDYINNYYASDPGMGGNSRSSYYNDGVYRGGANALTLPYYGGASAQDLAMRGPAPPRIERWGQAHPVPSGPQSRSGGPYRPQVGPEVPQMDPDLINSYLGRFGTSLPSHIDPNILFGNAAPGSFADRHQRIAGALDNATGVLANMGPPGATVGENISNVARGLMGNKVAHQQNAMAQVMAPFGMANQINNLQQGIDAHNLSKAHQLYFNEMGKYHQGMLKHYEDIESGRASRADERAAATRPLPDGFGGALMFNPETEKWEHSDFEIAAKNPIDGLVASMNKYRAAQGLPGMNPKEEADYRASLNAKGVGKPRPVGRAGGPKVDPADSQAISQAKSDLAEADRTEKTFFSEKTFAIQSDPEVKAQHEQLKADRDAKAQRLQSIQDEYDRKYPNNVRARSAKTKPTVKVYNPATGRIE